MPDMRGDEFQDRPELIRKRARSIILWRLLVFFIALYMVVTTTIIAVSTVVDIQTRQSSRDTLEELVDCTDPRGECYRQSQERSREAIQELLDASRSNAVTTREVVVAAAACAERPQNNTLREIRLCVEEVLNR